MFETLPLCSSLPPLSSLPVHIPSVMADQAYQPVPGWFAVGVPVYGFGGVPEGGGPPFRAIPREVHI